VTAATQKKQAEENNIELNQHGDVCNRKYCFATVFKLASACMSPASLNGKGGGEELHGGREGTHIRAER